MPPLAKPASSSLEGGSSKAADAPAPLTDEQIDELRQRCEGILANEAAAFERELKRRNLADYKWIMQVKRSGTTSDKVAAITLQVQESVVANLSSLDSLISWVQKRKGGREVARQAIEALQELFCSVLLPDRKLVHFEQQPLHLLPAGKEGSKYLLWWYLEDQIKVRYNLLIAALEECSRDNLDFLKDRATKAIYQLLAKKPEGEAKLLAALVNKLGDPNRKIASKTGYLLSQLLLQHPVMKPIVAREVERFLFRPGLQTRARYYAIVFLNQLPLSHKEKEGGPALARRLVDLYFTMFRLIVEGQVGSAAEVGKAQAERYRKEMAVYLRQKKRQDEQQATAAPKKGGKGAAAGIKAKAKKLVPPKKPKAAVPEEMDARMLSALIVGIRRAFPYVATEDVEPLIERNSQQLFRLVHVAPFPVAVQALMLMWQLFSTQATISERFYRALYAVLSSDGPATSSKAPMFLALLYKAMRVDVSPKRAAAFAKRLLQVAIPAPAHFACGALLLLSEVLKVQPALWAGLMQPEEPATAGGLSTKAGAGKAQEDEDFEVFKDLDDEEQEGGAQQGATREGAGKKANSAEPGVQEAWPKPGYYDMQKREPLYAMAERACWWELLALAAHAHPSVAAMARTLMSGQPVVYDGDPMQDHSLVAFLDKFIVKKPKANVRSGSVMQPPVVRPSEHSVAQLGHEAFSALAESEVQPDEVFFHRFHSLQTVKARRNAAQAAKKARKAKRGEDEGSEESSSDVNDMDEDETDAFMDDQEAGVDDTMGDPDVGGFDYDQLEKEMNEEGSEGASDDEEYEEEEEGGDADDDGAEGSSEGFEGSSGGEDQPSEAGDEDAALAGTAEGSEEQDDGYDEELQSLGLKGIMGLPSPSESEEEEQEEEGDAAGQRGAGKKNGARSGAANMEGVRQGVDKGSSRKRARPSHETDKEEEEEEEDGDAKLGARTFDFSEEGSDEEGGEDVSPPPASSDAEDEDFPDMDEGNKEEEEETAQAAEEESDGHEEDDGRHPVGSQVAKGRQGPNTTQHQSKKQKHGQKKTSVFASADDYADVLAEFERQQQQQGGQNEDMGSARQQHRQKKPQGKAAGGSRKARR
ncbi:CBF/Mak21 family-domain-containing protein [Dunaliella salina]|nr:CBF/Mak21 family-domain-containing protein [Dunaliella salina]|eukprot:KAF5834970.1 CBF/Mak21 family-domain-containing protein [Dunaliella salina]